MSTERAKRLLVVDDNAITREGMARVLRREGYEVVLAANGLEALDCLDGGAAPDLIMLDMLMPVLDGWHFLQRLQKVVLPAHICIVVATSSTVISREWAQDHGCTGFLRKPIDPEELLQEIRRCLSPAS